MSTDHTPTLTDAERIADDLLADTDLLTPNHDGTPEWYAIEAENMPQLVERILTARVSQSGDECRWCPPNCRSCEPADCECYRHQDWTDKATDPDWPYVAPARHAEEDR